MKIESTKNIIKEIEGTNTFEVLTFGREVGMENLENMDLGIKYILDMSSIEIVVGKDANGKLSGKVIVNVKEDEDGNVLSYKEL